MKLLSHFTIVLFLLLFAFAIDTNAQQKQKFSVASFELDQFDLTAKNDKYKKVDSNGSLYAIIKVTSNNPDDDLSAYNFDFNYLNHHIEKHDDELWVYVQRNAKYVTISRQGFVSIGKYDLKTTIEEGRTYTMQLSTAPVKILTQMVLFSVQPADCKAMVTVKAVSDDAVEDVVGITDETGATAKSLTYNTYTYKVVAEGFFPSEGRFTLQDMTKTHEERVILRPRFASITLKVNSDADIYVNGELKGREYWTGRLNSGNYQVECRQAGHRSSSMAINVKENENKSYDLPLPTPITGILSITSQPLGAEINIDGKPMGKTPQQIPQVLIGNHKIEIVKSGYENANESFEIKEDQTTNLKIVLKKTSKVKEQTVHEEKVSVTPVQNTQRDFNKSFKYTYKGVTFKCKAKKGEVTITGFDVDAKEVTIPANVEYGNHYYPVKEIDTFINGNNYSAMRLVIEEGVETIANYAFVEFRKLVNVTLPNTIKEVGRNAFRDSQGLKFDVPPHIYEGTLRAGRAIKTSK